MSRQFSANHSTNLAQLRAKMFHLDLSTQAVHSPTRFASGFAESSPGLNIAALLEDKSNLGGSDPLPGPDERRLLVADVDQTFLDLKPDETLDAQDFQRMLKTFKGC